MITFTTVVLWLHLTALILWLGGWLVLGLLCLPTLRRQELPAAQRRQLISGLLQRFRSYSIHLIGLIILTGIFNLINVALMRGFQFSRTYLLILGAKLLLFAVLIALQMRPTAIALRGETPQESGREPAQSPGPKLRLWLLFAVLAVLALFLGLSLRHLA